MSKKSNALTQQYYRERHRVQSLINRYAKKYEEVNISLPAIPKRITQGSIRRLSKITPEKVRKKTYTANPNTGERITLKQFLKLSSSKSKSKPVKVKSKKSKVPKPKVKTKSQQQYEQAPLPDYTDIIFQNFYNTIALYPSSAQDIMHRWLATLFEKTDNDRTVIADMLQQAAADGLIATYQEAYNSALIYENLSKMVNMLDISAGEKNEIFKDLEMENDFYEEEYF